MAEKTGTATRGFVRDVQLGDKIRRVEGGDLETVIQVKTGGWGRGAGEDEEDVAAQEGTITLRLQDKFGNVNHVSYGPDDKISIYPGKA